jgi:hypothetical protein
MTLLRINESLQCGSDSMRQIAGHLLWIGHAGDLHEPRALLAAGIEAIVELADNEQFTTLPRDLIRLRFPLSDSGENPVWLLRLAVNSVTVLLKAGVPTIVCCSCGLNRSVCVAAAALAALLGRPIEETLLEISQVGPADVSPRLMHGIREAILP